MRLGEEPTGRVVGSARGPTATTGSHRLDGGGRDTGERRAAGHLAPPLRARRSQIAVTAYRQ